MRLRFWGRWATGLVVVAGGSVVGQVPFVVPGAAPTGLLRQGREMLMKKQFAEAKKVFGEYLKAHPRDVQGEFGLGDAELGMHEYEAAEMSYRSAVAQQPELWQAHKNLVVVEAALGRWEEFEGERKILRLARERGAPGISAGESDVIDSFTAGGAHWVVRAYFQPLGRSQARYNFERFSPEGRVLEYVSLEDAAAAVAALQPGDVRIGTMTKGGPANSASGTALSLNWYTGAAHGVIRTYSGGEPPYERLRAEAMHWMREHPAPPGARR